MKREDFMKLVATGAITPLITSTAADKNGNAPKRSTGQNPPNGVVKTIADLKKLGPNKAATIQSANNYVQVLGYFEPGDGGGGSFYWDPDSTASANGGTVISMAANKGSGRWRRIIENNFILAEWFGVDGKNDHNAIQAAIDFALQRSEKGSKTEVRLGTSGKYVCNQTIKIDNEKISLNGNGAVLDFSGAKPNSLLIDITHDSDTYRRSSYKSDTLKNLSMIGGGRNSKTTAVRVNLSDTGNINPSFTNVTISEFGTGFILKNNVWGEVFHNCQMTNCGTIIYSPMATNAAERMSFIDCLLAESDVVFRLETTDFIHLTNCSVDYNKIIYRDKDPSVKSYFWFDHCNIESGALNFFDLINSSVIIDNSNIWNAGKSAMYKLTVDDIPAGAKSGKLVAGKTSSGVGLIASVRSDHIIVEHTVNEFFMDDENVFIANSPSATTKLKNVELYRGIIHKDPTEFGSSVSISNSFVVGGNNNAAWLTTGSGNVKIDNLMVRENDVISSFAILSESSNKLFNGNFEQGSKGWSLSGRASVTTRNTYRGKNSLMIPKGSTAQRAHTFIPYDGESIINGQLFVHPNSPETGGLISIAFYYDEDTVIRQAKTNYLINSMTPATWNRVVFNIKEEIPPTTNFISLTLTNQYGSNDSVSYFDEILVNMY